MSLPIAVIVKLEAGQAKTELRALQGEVAKTGAVTKTLGAEAKGAGAGVEKLGDESGPAAAKVKALADAELLAARESSNLVGSLGKVQTGGFLAGNSARMFSQQLSQVGQQAMATGQFVTALAIQLPDIGIAFGAVGGAEGLLAGIGLPLLVNAFSGSRTEALSAKGAVDEFSSSLDTYKNFVQLSSTSTLELTKNLAILQGKCAALPNT